MNWHIGTSWLIHCNFMYIFFFWRTFPSKITVVNNHSNHYNGLIIFNVLYKLLSIFYSITITYLKDSRPSTTVILLQERLRYLRNISPSNPVIASIALEERSKCFKFLRVPKPSIHFNKLQCRFSDTTEGRRFSFEIDVTFASIRQTSLEFWDIIRGV